eukprot:354880-Chlamydomonas_euryale.AAC.3
MQKPQVSSSSNAESQWQQETGATGNSSTLQTADWFSKYAAGRGHGCRDNGAAPAACLSYGAYMPSRTTTCDMRLQHGVPGRMPGTMQRHMRLQHGGAWPQATVICARRLHIPNPGRRVHASQAELHASPLMRMGVGMSVDECVHAHWLTSAMFLYRGQGGAGGKGELPIPASLCYMLPSGMRHDSRSAACR